MPRTGTGGRGPVSRRSAASSTRRPTSSHGPAGPPASPCFARDLAGREGSERDRPHDRLALPLERVTRPPGVVAVGEIRALVGAAAFLPREGRARGKPHDLPEVFR